MPGRLDSVVSPLFSAGSVCVGIVVVIKIGTGFRRAKKSPVPETRLPRRQGKILTDRIVVHVQGPVQSPQLLTELAPLVAAFQSSGDGRANPAGPLDGGLGDGVD